MTSFKASTLDAFLQKNVSRVDKLKFVLSMREVLFDRSAFEERKKEKWKKEIVLLQTLDESRKERFFYKNLMYCWYLIETDRQRQRENDKDRKRLNTAVRNTRKRKNERKREKEKKKERKKERERERER